MDWRVWTIRFHCGSLWINYFLRNFVESDASTAHYNGACQLLRPLTRLRRRLPISCLHHSWSLTDLWRARSKIAGGGRHHQAYDCSCWWGRKCRCCARLWWTSNEQQQRRWWSIPRNFEKNTYKFQKIRARKLPRSKRSMPRAKLTMNRWRTKVCAICPKLVS